MSATDSARATPTTLSADIFERAAALKRAGEPFVLATVVWSQRPTSARPGAKGIVTPDGALFGWVGGSCAQPTVVQEALRALEDGQPRILSLRTDESTPPRPDVIVAPMTCQSGGSLEVFLEPFLPPLHLIVVGDSPVADALIRLGHVMGYRVTAARPDSPETAPSEADRVLDGLDFGGVVASGRSVAVIASMGVYDEEAVEQALRAGVGYVALVASNRRFDALRDTLLADGITTEQLERVKAPAGIDIAASAPEEIAVSILAEIIARRSTLPATTSLTTSAGESSVDEGGTSENGATTAIDPVCGMTVEIASARHHYEHQGEQYYFCCPGCRRQFMADPERFLAAT